MSPFVLRLRLESCSLLKETLALHEDTGPCADIPQIFFSRVPSFLFPIVILASPSQQMYKVTDKESFKLAKSFKETFSRDVDVDFVGVW